MTMDEKSIEKEQEKPAEKTRVYTPPALTRYGKLTELTASGTAGEKETNPGGQPNKMA
jgi:hypothetical protein